MINLILIDDFYILIFNLISLTQQEHIELIDQIMHENKLTFDELNVI